MRNDVIDGLDTDPKCARGLGSTIEQFGTAGPHRLKVVLEINRPSLGKGLVGADGGEYESGSPAETDLTEEIIRNTRARSGVIGTDDDRCSAVTHHHEIYQLAHVFTGALRVEVNGASLGADNCNCFDTGSGDKSLRDHERVREAGACLLRFPKRSRKADAVGDEGDIRRDEASRAGRMADEIREVAHNQPAFF